MYCSYPNKQIPCSLSRGRTNWDKRRSQVDRHKNMKPFDKGYWMMVKPIEITTTKLENVREDPFPCWGTFITVISWPSFPPPLNSPPEEECEFSDWKISEQVLVLGNSYFSLFPFLKANLPTESIRFHFVIYRGRPSCGEIWQCSEQPLTNKCAESVSLGIYRDRDRDRVRFYLCL